MVWTSARCSSQGDLGLTNDTKEKESTVNKIRRTSRGWKPWNGRIEEPVPNEAWERQGEGKSMRPGVGIAYLTFVGGFTAAVAIVLFLAMRGPEGQLDVEAVYDRLDAQSAFVRGLVCAISLALVAVTVDLIGRVGATIASALLHGQLATPRRWARLRFAVQAAFLMLLGLCVCLAPEMLPLPPHGWVRIVFPAAMLAPVCLSAAEWWMR